MKSYKLYDGNLIPSIGFGTWQTPDGETAISSVKEALKVGYRHIDTASAYENEKSVGEGIAQSGVERKDIFVTSKLWNSDRGYDTTLKACERSLKDLGLEYLDLYLIHWTANENHGDWKKINADTWRAMERLKAEGLVRNIGVSNYLVRHMEALMAVANEKPAIDQIEYHPGYMQQDTVDLCRKNDILIEAWSPIGSGLMLTNETLLAIAAKYQKSVAQLCIRWCLQNGTLPLPKSVTPHRIKENLQVFDFEISVQDMQTIDALSECGWSGYHPDELTF